MLGILIDHKIRLTLSKIYYTIQLRMNPNLYLILVCYLSQHIRIPIRQLL